MKNMVEGQDWPFPIASPLLGVSIMEDKEFEGDGLELDRVELIFPNMQIMLTPIADTDEIEIEIEFSPALQAGNGSQVAAIIDDEEVMALLAANTPIWCRSFLGQKLQTVWVCENSQGYRDQIIFAFGLLHPSLTFLCEGSAIQAFRSEQVLRKQALAIELAEVIQP